MSEALAITALADGWAWINSARDRIMDWTGPESVTLFRATAPQQVQRMPWLIGLQR